MQGFGDSQQTNKITGFVAIKTQPNYYHVSPR